MTQPVLLAALSVLVVLAVTGLLVIARRLRSAAAEVAAVRAEATDLRVRLEQVEAAQAGPPTVSGPVAASFVITEVGTPPAPAVPTPPVADGRQFADTVLREAVVRGAGLGHGVRRALTPEVRHHIRLEMRREVKRARKQRRSDLREAQRAWAAAGRRATP